MHRNRSCTESIIMYRNGPLSQNYVPKLYVPKVSCTDMDLPRRFHPHFTRVSIRRSAFYHWLHFLTSLTSHAYAHYTSLLCFLLCFDTDAHDKLQTNKRRRLHTDKRLRIRATSHSISAQRLPVNFRRSKFNRIPFILHLKC